MAAEENFFSVASPSVANLVFSVLDDVECDGQLVYENGIVFLMLQDIYFSSQFFI